MITPVLGKPIADLREPPLVGSMPAFQKDRLRLYLRILRECGDAGRMHFGPFAVLVFNTPDVVQSLLVEHAQDLDKGFALHRALTPVAGQGLINNEGESWRQQRKLIAPVFAHRHLAGYADTMVVYSERLQAGWATGATIDVAREMTTLTMSIVGKALFDVDVFDETDDLAAAITTAVQYMEYAIKHFFPTSLRVPTPRSLRTRAAMALIRRRIQAMIDARRASGADRGDLLSLLLAARDESGAGMSDAQIRDEAITLFIAGHETTANTLAWCWYFLARDPTIYATLQAEVDAVLGGRPPALADLPQLPYALQVFKEALRLYPPADSLTRTVLKDIDVAGYHLRKNDIVVIPMHALHRRPASFPDPERFDPERWTPAREKALPRYAYMPFGAGPRICIGNHFALLEGQLVLATLAQRVTFALVPGQQVVAQPVFAVRQKYGCRVVVRRRDE